MKYLAFVTLLFISATFDVHASNPLDKYKESIFSIRQNIDTLDLSYINYSPAKSVKEVPRKYQFLTTFIQELNLYMFGNENHISLNFCDETAFGKFRICLSQTLLAQIEINFPDNKEYIMKFIVAHELGHYLQDLHCKIHSSHVSINRCIYPEDLKKGFSNGSEEYLEFIKLHNGTDNYAFSLLDVLNIKPANDELIGRDLYILFKITLSSNGTRIDNALSVFGLNQKEVIEQILSE